MGDQKTIVVEHYPVERLPDDIRERIARSIGDGPFVKLHIEVDALPADAGSTRPFDHYFGKGDGTYSGLDPIDDIRKLRDEWE